MRGIDEIFRMVCRGEKLWCTGVISKWRARHEGDLRFVTIYAPSYARANCNNVPGRINKTRKKWVVFCASYGTMEIDLSTIQIRQVEWKCQEMLFEKY